MMRMVHESSHVAGGRGSVLTLHHCIMLKPYFRWVGSHLPGLTSAHALVCDHICKPIHKNLNTCSSTLRAQWDSTRLHGSWGGVRDSVITFQLLGWRQHRGYYSSWWENVSSLSSDDQTHSSCRRNVAAWNHFGLFPHLKKTEKKNNKRPGPLRWSRSSAWFSIILFRTWQVPSIVVHWWKHACNIIINLVLILEVTK